MNINQLSSSVHDQFVSFKDVIGFFKEDFLCQHVYVVKYSVLSPSLQAEFSWSIGCLPRVPETASHIKIINIGTVYSLRNITKENFEKILQSLTLIFTTEVFTKFGKHTCYDSFKTVDEYNKFKDFINQAIC